MPEQDCRKERKKREFEQALARMRHGTRTKAKPSRSTVTIVGKERADRIVDGSLAQPRRLTS